jgi:hypothetical protein
MPVEVEELQALAEELVDLVWVELEQSTQLALLEVVQQIQEAVEAAEDPDTTGPMGVPE